MAFMNIGISWNVSSELFSVIEEFVRDLYGKKMKNVNLLRYEMYCAKGGKIEPEDLPPCHSSQSYMLQGQIIKLAFGIERYWHVLIFHAQTVMVGRYLDARLTSDGWDQSLPLKQYLN